QEISQKPFFSNPSEHIKLNPYVCLGISIGAILQWLALYVLSDYLHTVKLSVDHLVYVFPVPILTFLGIEIRKWLYRK
ncbi:MAG: cation transporting ATPase C-terminal domain-containing protein, partial [Caldimicrobium sp.]